MRKFKIGLDKNYLKKALLAVFAAFFSLGVIVYACFHVAEYFKSDISLLNAAEKTVIENIRTDAYIFRDELPLYTSGRNSGSITAVVSDGRRIAVNDRVADVYSHISSDEKKRIAEIDRQILLLEQSRIDNVSVQGVAGLDSEIYKNIETISRNSHDGNFGDALACRAELLVSITRKNVLTGETKNIEDQIELLTAEKSALTLRLGTRLESVYSPCSGYYYSNTDGYEGIFTTDVLDSLTYDGFYKLLEREPETVSSTAAGKIAVDFRWYIACPMSKSDAAVFQKNRYYSIQFPYTNTHADMKLYSVIDQPGGEKAVVVFQCTTLFDDFDYTRMQTVLISAKEQIGFEIPVTAIRVVDGLTGVYIFDDGMVDFRRVNIIREYDGICLCVGDLTPPDEKTEADTKSEETAAESQDSEENKPKKVYRWIKRNDIIITEGTNLAIGDSID